jgi:hypothetical protein
MVENGRLAYSQLSLFHLHLETIRLPSFGSWRIIPNVVNGKAQALPSIVELEI